MGADLRFEGPTLLVIDDAADTRELLASVVEELGVRALTAAGGGEGVAMAARESPDLVVLDLLMDPMDGWETLRLLRLGAEQLPVVIVSARDRPQDKIRALQEGAHDYITKPFKPRAVASRLARLLVELGHALPTVSGETVPGETVPGETVR